MNDWEKKNAIIVWCVGNMSVYDLSLHHEEMRHLKSSNGLNYPHRSIWATLCMIDSVPIVRSNWYFEPVEFEQSDCADGAAAAGCGDWMKWNAISNVCSDCPIERSSMDNNCIGMASRHCVSDNVLLMLKSRWRFYHKCCTCKVVRL